MKIPSSFDDFVKVISVMRPSQLYLIFLGSVLILLAKTTFMSPISVFSVFVMGLLTGIWRYGITKPFYQKVKKKPIGNYKLFTFSVVFQAIAPTIIIILTMGLLSASSVAAFGFLQILQMFTTICFLYSVYYSFFIYSKTFSNKVSFIDFLIPPWGFWNVQPLMRNEILKTNEKAIGFARKLFFIIIYLVIIMYGSLRSMRLYESYAM